MGLGGHLGGRLGGKGNTKCSEIGDTLGVTFILNFGSFWGV